MRDGRILAGMVCAFLILIPTAAAVDFSLEGDDHLDVTLSYDNGVLWDSSTADILEGGYIKKAYVNGNATLNVRQYRYGTSGESIKYIYAYNNSTVAVSEGQVGTKDFDTLYTYDASTAIISGGSVNWLVAGDSSNLSVSGGIVSELTATGDSTVTVSGGQFGTKTFNSFQVRENSNAHISGGNINWLIAYDTSQVNISGGYVGGVLEYPPNQVGGDSLIAYDTSHVNISDGNIKKLYAYDISYVNIHGGNTESLNAHNLKLEGQERVNITGGTVENLNAYIALEQNEHLDYTKELALSDMAPYGLHVADGTEINLNIHLKSYANSSVDISGGSIQGISAADTSKLSVSGGSVQSISASGNSTVTISSGGLSSLSAFGNSVVKIVGSDFQSSGEVAIVGEEVIGTGILRGKWLDGAGWTIIIEGNAATARILVSAYFPPDEPEDPYCGDKEHPYPPMDFNMDCRVDLADFAMFAVHWMKCTAPECD